MALFLYMLLLSLVACSFLCISSVSAQSGIEGKRGPGGRGGRGGAAAAVAPQVLLLSSWILFPSSLELM